MKVIQLCKNPNYCCDYWEYYNNIHKRCKFLYIDSNTFEVKCKHGIPFDEDQMPPEMDCSKRVECEVNQSIYAEVELIFKTKELKNEK